MLLVLFLLCQTALLAVDKESLRHPDLVYRAYEPKPTDRVIVRTEYFDQLYGFWLGQNIANWTGLLTELDKVGNTGGVESGPFYTRDDWGSPTRRSYTGADHRKIAPTIDFYFVDEDGVWGSDDDTDLEYMYQHLLFQNKTSVLSPEQIRDGWLHHIYSEKKWSPHGKDREGNYRNFLWVSNQRAYNLMEEYGMFPPFTGEPTQNEHFDMIDAQLTTEIFGLFAPARADVALRMAYLPIRTTAYENAAWIAEFYVIMHSLASRVDRELPMREQILWLAETARTRLPEHGYSAKMFDFVRERYDADITWEEARDEVYLRYQVEQEDGYDLTSRQLRCNGCFAAGINFAASLISLFWGEGDIKETIKIATLAGWDSDNPAATWGGLLGFMIGKKGVEEAFGRTFSNRYNIHRTRRNFLEGGIDTFDNMARTGVFVIDRVVQEEMGGGIDLEKDVWYIPEAEPIRFY